MKTHISQRDCVSATTLHDGGYTLIELLTVATLSVFILSIAATGYYQWTRTTSLDSAAAQFHTLLALTRDHAVSKLIQTRLTILSDTRGNMLVPECKESAESDAWIPFSRTNRLDWIEVSDAESKAVTEIYFRSDGSCCLTDEEVELDATDAIFELRLISKKAGDTAENRIRVITVDPRTGRTKQIAREYKDGK